MKAKKLFLSVALMSCTLFGTIACGSTGNTSNQVSQQIQYVDYASQYKFDEKSGRATEIVTLKNHVDGDTSHFYSQNGENGVLKARYLGIDTPESTGKIQPWGKAASNFVKERLTNAAEIMIESNDEKWNLDSTSTRYLVYVWYRPAAGADWKLLNLEVMQEGLAAAKNIGGTCHKDILKKAYDQAVSLKLKYYSDDKDPDYPYGDAKVVSLCEIRTNIEDYKDQKVQFDALVTRVSGQTAYVEDFDAETNRYYGIAVYMGFVSYDIIEKGNLITWVGMIEYYETGGSYQLSGLTYVSTKPNYKDNIKLISEGNEVVPHEIDGTELEANGDLLQGTNVSMKNLTVDSVYTTSNGGDNDGAMTITCHDANSKSVKLRTSVLYKEDKTLVTKADIEGKTLDLSAGIVDTFDGETQVHVFSYKDLIIK